MAPQYFLDVASFGFLLLLNVCKYGQAILHWGSIYPYGGSQCILQTFYFGKEKKNGLPSTLVKILHIRCIHASERIQKSPFCNSNIIPGSGKDQRSQNLVEQLSGNRICVLFQKSPHKFLVTVTDNCTFTVGKSGSHQLCISKTETAGYYAI